MARTDPVGQPKAKHRATGIKVSEISFVDEPAVPGARFVVVKRRDASMAESVTKAAPTKTDGGVTYGKDAFLYTPDDEPSHWKLRIKEVVEGEQKVTRAQLGRAAAAFSAGGFRGQKVDIPSEDIATVKAKLRGLYKDLGVKPADIPEQVRKCDGCGGMMPTSLDDDDGGEKKDRATVNYRLGGDDTNGDGITDQCGSCDFFQGPLSLTADQVFVGECSLVSGDIGSNMVCDLYEVADAFSLVEKAKRLEAVTKEGRMLSTANMEKMKAAMQAAKDAIDTMQGMMDAASPKTEKRTELTPGERAFLGQIRASLEAHVTKYSEDQPRVPAGQPGGGQFGSGGGSTGGAESGVSESGPQPKRSLQDIQREAASLHAGPGAVDKLGALHEEAQQHLPVGTKVKFGGQVLEVTAHGGHGLITLTPPGQTTGGHHIGAADSSITKLNKRKSLSGGQEDVYPLESTSDLTPEQIAVLGSIRASLEPR